MQLQSMDDTISIPEKGQTEMASLLFVCKLLAATLIGQNDEVVFEPQEFIIDQSSGIGTNGSLRTEIDREDIIEKDGKIRIILSGTVENDQKQKEVFTLYFFIWLNGCATTSVINIYQKDLRTNSLLIHFDHTTEPLLDSVFELNIYRRSPASQSHFVGYGRGYLVFGRRV